MNRIPEYLAARIPFYYGYLVAFMAVWALICSSPGQTFAITAFTPSLREELGLSSSQLSGAYLLGTILAAIPLSLIGFMADRFGLQKTTAWVALGLSLACWFISFANGFTTLFLGFLFLRFLGQGALSLLSGNMVSMWFQLRLGRVNAAMSVGIAGAFGLVPSLLLWSIENFGWRTTYVAMGCVVSATLLPMLVLFLKNRPEDLGLHPDGLARSFAADENGGLVESPRERNLTLLEACRGRAFWILGIGMGIWAMVGTGIIFFAIPVFGEFGISPEAVPYLFGTFSVSMLTSQVLGGVLADRFPMHRLLALGFLSLTLGASVVPLTSSVLHMHVFALLFGVGQGVALASSATLWVRYYGRENLGRIRGAVWCTTVAGSGVGPFLLGVFKDSWGSFVPGLWLFAGLLLPMGPLMLWATTPIVKTNDAPELVAEE